MIFSNMFIINLSVGVIVDKFMDLKQSGKGRGCERRGWWIPIQSGRRAFTLEVRFRLQRIPSSAFLIAPLSFASSWQLSNRQLSVLHNVTCTLYCNT